MNLMPCSACTELVTSGTCVCPHCGGKACKSRPLRGAAVLLGLSLVACGGDETNPTGTATSTGTVQADYSAPVTGSMSTGMTEDEAAEYVDLLLEETEPEPAEQTDRDVPTR